MNIRDISPGYLRQDDLLQEHQELHQLITLLAEGDSPCANHPEVIRWRGYGWALKIRHKQLACEMALHGYEDPSPVTTRTNKGCWPDAYREHPAQQFAALKENYRQGEGGRIPLPINEQQLWAQHKYSILARNPERYKSIGREVSCGNFHFDALSQLLTETLREPPTTGKIRNAIQHMWGYVSNNNEDGAAGVGGWTARHLLAETQKRAMMNRSIYLCHSTALSELMVWL